MTENKKSRSLTKKEHVQILEAQLAGIQEDMPGAILEDMQVDLIEERMEIANMLKELKSN